MISRTNNTNFGAAYIKMKPKAVNINPQSIEIPEEPVLKRINDIVNGPRCNWEAHSKAMPQTPSLKPRVQINPNSPTTITAQIGDEEYLLTQSHDKYHDTFMHIFNMAKQNLK